MGNELINTIFVIGYPKSGTTWVTRLLSQSLNIKIARMGIHGYPEVASETNEYLDKNKVDGDFQIVKTHDSPQVIRKYLNGSQLRGVYVVRDFRDVLVSSIFYFNSNKYFLHFLSKKLKKKLNPLVKMLLDNKIHKFTKETIYGKVAHKIIWDSHIKSWEKEAKKVNSNITFIRYEDLKSNPEKALKKVIKLIKIKYPTDKKIKEVVEFQSFRNTKNRNIKDDNMRKINTKLMRRGGTGDWTKILPLKSISQIKSAFNKTLSRWNY